MNVDQAAGPLQSAATWKGRKSGSASPTPLSGRLPQPPPPMEASNSMHDSFTPLGGLVPLLLIQLEKSFSGEWGPACTHAHVRHHCRICGRAHGGAAHRNTSQED
jgi:hypothetical protein